MKKPPKRKKRVAGAAKKDSRGALLQQLIQLTGIPAKTIRKELKGILDRHHIDLDNLTVEQLRIVVASYLRQIMGGLLDRRHNVRRADLSH